MKKIMFISTFLSAFILNTLICSAAPTPPDEFTIEFGTTTDAFKWSTLEGDGTYSLSFEVESDAGLNLTIKNSKKYKTVLFYNAGETDNSWTSGTGSWTKNFTKGAYTLTVLGNSAVRSSKAVKSSKVRPVPIPGALLLLGSGIFSLFLVRRPKELLA